jgi:hypothetical protein
MRKLYLIIAVALGFAFKAEADKIEGQIIIGSDTVNVTMKIPVDPGSLEVYYASLQSKLKYYDSLGKKKVLLPGDAT